MSDILTIAEFGLVGALFFVAAAFVCNLVIFLADRARTVEPAPVAVGAAVGAGGPEVSVVLPGQDGPIAPTTPGAEPAARRGGLDRWGTAFGVAAFALVTIYLVIRWVETGHGPFANQHEFAVSFIWGILAAYLVAEWRYKLRAVSLLALPVAATLLVCALVFFKSDTEPLMPALQNNLLLTMHVGFAVLAYGPACVSAGAAVLYLLHPHLNLKALPSREYLDQMGYKASIITFPFLTIMIVLGSVWADIAWGHYWSWDPKETAALVTWLIYGAYLHARVTRRWTGVRSAWLLILGFAAVLFCYFGNLFFGGLHSYA